MSSSRHRVRTGGTALLLLVVALSAAACGDATGEGAAPNGPAVSLSVVASFYPLAYAADRVGGEAVTVMNLTPAGVEPHDLELAPDDLEAIAQADVVVYLGGGFQPAVEEAVEAEANGVTVDALDGLELLPPTPEDDPNHSDHGDDEPIGDPHVWLDPARYAAVVDRVADAFVGARPADAETLLANADAFRDELTALDGGFRRGLAECATRLMITNHAAFGYLAAAYDLDQRAISGLSPGSEPDPARLAELAEQAQTEGVTTVFTEDLLPPEVAETLAAEAGLETAVLSPLEGLTEPQMAAGDDYVSVMRRNLEALRDGLDCT